jgi:hypothetical protein
VAVKLAPEFCTPCIPPFASLITKIAYDKTPLYYPSH